MNLPAVFPPVAADFRGRCMFEVRPEWRSGRGRWWRDGGKGYTDDVSQAGIFPDAEGVQGSERAYAVSADLVLSWLAEGGPSPSSPLTVNDPCCTDIAAGLEAETDIPTLRRMALAWAEDCARALRNEDYYRGLLDACAPYLGPAVYTQDDGGIVDEPLRAKVPELVAALAARVEGPRG